MLFKYKIVDSKGKQSEGFLEAKDKFALYHAIKKEGVTVVSTEEVKGRKSFSLDGFLNLLNGVRSHDKIIFAKNLSKMIEAGLPVTRALSIMERQAKGKFKDVLKSIGESISKGNTFSDSLKDYPKVFSNLFVSMVRAGEESGNVALALKNIGDQMEKTYLLNKKIKGAMMYPTVIICLMVVIGALMMIYMVPTLTDTFVGLNIKLPLSTRIIIAISNFLINYILFAIIGLVVTVLFIIMAFRTKDGKKLKDNFFIKAPILGQMVKQIYSARTARTLSSLLSSGVDIVVAIGVTKDVLQNFYYKQVLEEVQTTIQKGDPISAVFAKYERLYPLFVSEMISVGEETGKIGEMLSGVANYYEEEVDQKTKNISSIIEPVIMVFIGVAVGGFAISMLAPTYSLVDAI
ncbi:MAG: type II secretion system F family protein [Minisyncoccia bacterium]